MNKARALPKHLETREPIRQPVTYGTFPESSSRLPLPQSGLRQMKLHHGILAGLCLAAGATSAAQLTPSPTCDRACLYQVLDGYLDALRAHDPQKVRWAAQLLHTENNVALRPGDGLWGTINASPLRDALC